MMQQALQIFMDYAAAFEETYNDDDWSRLTPFFPHDANYEVRGGPMACKIAGREKVFAGLKKSLDRMDRRCTDRKLELTDGPNVVATEDGSEVSLGWNAIYQYKDAPLLAQVCDFHAESTAADICASLAQYETATASTA